MSSSNKNSCNECQDQTPCLPICTGCPVLISSDCVNNFTEDLVYSGIIKGQTLTEVFVQFDEYINTKFEEEASYISLINVGAGSQVYKGISSIGKKQIRSILGSSLVSVTQGTDDITIGANTENLGSFVRSNQNTYSVSSIGVGASIYKDTTLLSNNVQFNLKKLKSNDRSVIITEGIDDINFSVVVAAYQAGEGISLVGNTFSNTSPDQVVSITGEGATTVSGTYPNFSISTSSPDGSETKLSAGSNITVSGSGTIESPYVVSSTGGSTPTQIIRNGVTDSSPSEDAIFDALALKIQPTGLEAIDGGSGIGWRLIGRDSANYAGLGVNAIDLSFSFQPGYGAIAEGSTISGGVNNKTPGYQSVIGGGSSNTASGSQSVVSGGISNTASGYRSIVSGGQNNTAYSFGEWVGGIYSQGYTPLGVDTWSGTDRIFTIGNGADTYATSNAFIILKNGLATLPSLVLSTLEAGSSKSIITKEYLESKLNLQKVITYPADFTGTNYTLVSGDNNYEIIIDNGATAVTITVPSGLTSKFGVGFTQEGTADVTYVQSGTTINNPTGLKIKGQYYQTYLSQKGATNTYFLGGNTKI